MKEKINIGCGMDIRPDFINLDKFNFKGVDKVWDINNLPLPFKENSFSEIILNHILEHLDDVVLFMEEIWRISKNGAIIKIKVPYFSSLDYIKDPTHKKPFSAATFEFFDKTKNKNSYFLKSHNIDFKIMKLKIIFSNNLIIKPITKLINLNQRFYERFLSYLLPASYLDVELRVVK